MTAGKVRSTPAKLVGLPGGISGDTASSTSLLPVPIKNVGVSRNCTVPRVIFNHIISRLAAGQRVPETELQPFCPRYRSDGIRAMRKVRQCYSRDTRLFLESGIWIIEPVVHR